jgi:hypothetical protein
MLLQQQAGMQRVGSNSMPMQLQPHQPLQQQQQLSRPMHDMRMVSSMGLAASAAVSGVGIGLQSLQQQQQQQQQSHPLLLQHQQQSWQQVQQYSPPYQGQQLSPPEQQMQQQMLAPSMQSAAQHMPPQLPDDAIMGMLVQQQQQQQHHQLVGYHHHQQQQQRMDITGLQPASSMPTMQQPYMQQQQQQQQFMLQQQAMAQQQLQFPLHQQQQQPFAAQQQQQQPQQHYMAQQQSAGASFSQQLVRISLKLHGVTPEHLPVATVAALHKLLSTSAAELETLLLGPAIRPGCVQLELDVLVKCPEASWQQQQQQQQQQSAEGSEEGSDVSTAGSVAAAADADGQEANSAAAAAAAAAGWPSCTSLVQAEQQLRQLVPFSRLVQALLEVPLDAAGAAGGGSGVHLGSCLTAVFGQIGDEWGAWQQGELLQDWDCSVSNLTDDQPPLGVSADSSSSGGDVMPKVVSVRPWSTFANEACGQQVQVEVCMAPPAAAPAAAAAALNSSGEPAAEVPPLRMWAAMCGAFLMLSSRILPHQQQQQQGLVHQLTVQLPENAAGLLLIQIERQLPLNQRLLQPLLHNTAGDSPAAAAVSRDQPNSQQQQRQQQQQHTSFSCMSKLVPVVICSSPEMAAEVEQKLRAQPQAAAYQMLVHLGLLLDFGAMLNQQQQQQQQQGGVEPGLTEQQLQHRQRLLTNRHYLSAMR